MARLALEIGKASDAGPSRERNEDYADFIVPEDEQVRRTEGMLFLVADGMGGHQAGQVASQEAVQRVADGYYARREGNAGGRLERVIQEANAAIHDQAQADPELAGMGTTLVAGLVRGKRRQVVIANVGDSRAYLLRGKRLKQITMDHSWVEAQFQAGLLTREQTKRHPQRNLITRALGIRPTVEVDIFRTRLRPGDALLLCTDGISGELSEEEMVQVLDSMQPEEAAAELVALANSMGGSDNATAIVVRVPARARRFGRDADLGNAGWPTPNWWRVAVLAAFVLLLALATVLIIYLLKYAP
jgi:protein phosphatase